MGPLLWWSFSRVHGCCCLFVAADDGNSGIIEVVATVASLVLLVITLPFSLLFTFKVRPPSHY